MNEAILRDRLLATVPELDDADWLDVRRRARAIEAPRRRNRRLLAIAAVLAILTALVVNPALGIGERLLDFIEGDPAPEEVRQSMRRAIPYGRFVLGRPVIRFQGTPPPEVPRAHLAVRLDSSVGPVYLWVAPAGGGACISLEIANRPRRPGGAGCDPAPTRETPLANFHPGGTSRVGENALNLVYGRVLSGVVRLEADLSDGRVAELRLVEGFFLAELPVYRLAERSTGCQRDPASFYARERGEEPADPKEVSCSVVPTEFRGFDANGRLLMRHEGTPIFDPTTAPPEPYRPATSIRLRSGRFVRIDAGGGCWRVVWDTGLLNLHSGGSCSSVERRDLPSRMLYGGPVEKKLVLLHGPVGSDIARVELVWSDATSERLKLENGFVLKEIDPDAKRRPARLVGRDESGRVVAEEAVK
jgi:hypothetical protein